MLGKRDVPQNVIMRKTSEGMRYGRIVTDGADLSKRPMVERVVRDEETNERRVETGFLYGVDQDWGQVVNASTYRVNRVEEQGKKRKVEKDETRDGSSFVSQRTSGKKSYFAEDLTSSGNGPSLSGSKPLLQRPARRVSSKSQPKETVLSTYDPCDNMSNTLPPLPRSESLHFDPMKANIGDVGMPTKSTSNPKGASSTSLKAAMPRSESQSILRHDFAASKKGTISSMLQNIRRRSRSPAKRKPDEKVASKSTASEDAVEMSRFRQQIESLRDAKTRNLAIPVDNQALPSQDDSSKSFQAPQPTVATPKTRSATVSHVKSSSMVSTGSFAEDNRSDTSSTVLSDAKSGIVYHGVDGKPSRTSFQTPPMPGPAPTTPLPSVPEGQDLGLPSTPRNSISHQRRNGSESSPAKVKSSPEKYSPFPRYSPPKRQPSPYRRNVYDGCTPEMESDAPVCNRIISNAQRIPTLKQFPIPPESPRRVSPAKDRRQGMLLLPSPVLPVELSGSEVQSRNNLNTGRAEKVADKKMRDMARQRSQTAEVVKIHEDIPSLPDCHKDKTSDEDVLKLPTPPPTESHSSLDVVSAYSDQSPIDTDLMRKISKSHRRVDSSVSQISRIFLIAEQVPSTPLKRTSSLMSRANNASLESNSVSAGAQDIHLSPSGLALLFGDLDKGEGMSSLFLLPPPKPRPVARRVPTPHTPELLRESSNRSSQHSSMIESNMEARVSRLETSNQMLVKAFMAVVDATAELSVSGGESAAWNSGCDHWSATGRRSGGSRMSACEDFVGNNDKGSGMSSSDRSSANGGNACCPKHTGRQFDDLYSRLEQALLGRPTSDRFST